MLKFYCEKEIILFQGVNCIGFRVEHIDETTNESLPLLSNTIVKCTDDRVDVSDYSIIRLNSLDFTIGDTFNIIITHMSESITEAITIVGYSSIKEPIVDTKETMPIELQILDGINLLIELQADMIGGAI